SSSCLCSYVSSIMATSAWVSPGSSLAGGMAAPARPRLSSAPSRGRGAGTVQRLDADVTELYRVVVSGETEVARLTVLARMRAVGHELRDLRYVGINDDVAVQLHLDRRPLDGHLLEVPLSGRTQVAAVRRHHAVDRAVVLPGVELLVLRRVVVKHLH